MDRTQRTPEPSGRSAPPLAQSFTNTALSDTLTSTGSFSIDANIRALGTNTEDILPALAEAVHDEIDELFGVEGTADSPVRLNIPPDATTDGGSPGSLAGAARAIAECLNEVAFETPFPSTAPQKITRFTNYDDTLIDKGYDSEGELPYICDEPQGDEEQPDDAVIPIGHAPPAAVPPVAAPVVAATIPIELTAEAIKSMKVKEMKEELKKRGKICSGNKGVLQARLVDAVNAGVPVTEAVVERDDSMRGLDVTAYWELLDKNPIPVPEPANEDDELRPPTEREGVTNPKYRYDEQFLRHQFTGTTAKMDYGATRKRPAIYGSRKRTKRKLSPTRQSRPPPNQRVQGGPNMDFLAKHNLDEKSHPMDWFNAILPVLPEWNLEDAKLANVKNDHGKTKFSISNWVTYSNMKAMNVNAGEKGHIYEGRHKPFALSTIMGMMGTYVLDGLSPSPQLVWKMRPQSVDSTQGNDFIARCMGSDYHQTMKSFRAFFGTQDPMMHPPPKDECPNFKCDEFFRWLRYIWPEAWLLAQRFSVDEQTCKMQGKSEYKTRCGKFKRIGDGLQTDCLADDGFTYDFYFRNEPVDKKWIDKGMCPLYARLLHMWSRIDDSFHGCDMDNLYTAVSLARMAYSLPKPVLIEGVMRKTGRGVSPCLLQEDVKGKRAEEARGTVKLALLRGDSQSCDLVVGSCFDQKPFYMLSHYIPEVTWVVKTKKVWSRVLKREIDYKFLRWSLSHNYNYEMNDNDIADQLRLVYRMQRFQRNQKWWWSLWLWGFEVSIVNSYCMMKRYCEIKGVPRPYSHYEWREKIGNALLDPEGQWPKWMNRNRKATGKKRKEGEQLKRKPKMTAATLSPTKGALSMRLNPTVGHFPRVRVGKKDNLVCQLHRTANRALFKDNGIPSGARKEVYECSGCGVLLCIKCWEIYHTVPQLEKKYCTVLGK